ncbi:hypothetical protein A2379_04575 [Candidatus Amesbacteria bacterium RIFOXYB1_FULL_47_13]|nr:MAG: hypothetical protein A2379_04575 [Candidatus Amesbacteria bacterium RIFOXYB1_FULL_47_13]
MKKGFTLIELLVTIGVLAVVAAGVIAAIDPLDKMKQGRDAKVQSDISSVATALNTFAAGQAPFLLLPPGPCWGERWRRLRVLVQVV